MNSPVRVSLAEQCVFALCSCVVVSFSVCVVVRLPVSLVSTYRRFRKLVTGRLFIRCLWVQVTVVVSVVLVTLAVRVVILTWLPLSIPTVAWNLAFLLLSWPVVGIR